MDHNSPPRILLVEDDALVRELLALQLVEGGIQAESAESGEEALEKFRVNPCDLVITDESMPGMSGHELATALKEIRPGLPVLLLTGFGELDASQSAGIDAVLAKPVDYTSLRETIDKLLGL